MTRTNVLTLKLLESLFYLYSKLLWQKIEKLVKMFKIGEFSKLVQVPIATLRYYDQVGLLKPIEVDRFTGYRYYSAAQLPRLHRILALKGLGFSLEQIAELLDENLSPEQMRGMLRLRHVQISQQIADMQDQLIEVESRIDQIEREPQLSRYDIILKQVEPLLVAYVRTILVDHSQSGSLFGEVYTAIEPYITDVTHISHHQHKWLFCLCVM